MLASYLLDATRSAHPLEELALEHAGYKALREEDLCGRGAKAISFRELPVDARCAISPANAPTWRCRCRPRCGSCCGRNSSQTLYETLELPLVPVLVDDRARRRPHRRRRARGAVRQDRPGARAPRVGHLRAVGRGVQHQLAEEAVGSAVRQARDEDRDDPADDQDEGAVDVVRSARGAGARPRAAAAGPRVARADEAERHLHRRAAAAGQPGDRPGAHLLQPGGRRHRTVEQQRSQPAEHPDPHRGRPRDPRAPSSPSPATC